MHLQSMHVEAGRTGDGEEEPWRAVRLGDSVQMGARTAEAATVIRGRRRRRAVDTAGEATGWPLSSSWPTAITGLLRGLSSP